MMVRNEREQSSVRRYLLNQLNDAEQRAVERELLTDEAFSEELEIVEDELIDEYLKGELSRKERIGFEKFFLTHETRKHKFRAGETLKRHFDKVSPSPTPPRIVAVFRQLFNPFSLPAPITAAVAILAVAVVGGVIWRAFFYQSNLQKGLIALNQSYRQERPVEARISSFDYAPFRPTRGEPGKVDTLEQTRAERLLTEAFSDNPNADANHALGKMYLSRRVFDKAIEHLEQAERADANDASIYADLGAAYLEKGKLDTNLGPNQDAFRFSLENLNHALELKPDLREALFNRALIHQYQGQNDRAASDWRSYLEQDSNSPWATEARDNLRLLEEGDR
jgi:tetratricopeptide (TPR) repeat protein